MKIILKPVEEGGSYRVLRGGSWNIFAWYARVSSRLTRGPSRRFDDRGFRLARSMK